jgi:hypothetical protein
MTVAEVVDYYQDLPDVAQAICRAGRGRRVQVVNQGERVGPVDRDIPGADQPETLIEHVNRHFQDLGLLPDHMPASYPGFHATVARDIVLEVDRKQSQRAAFAETRRAIDFLDRYDAPYRLKFSGNSSAHVIIPASIYLPLLPDADREAASHRFRAWVIRSCGADVDGSFTSDDHFLRLPYSLNEVTGLVSLPLRMEQYDGFEPCMAERYEVHVEEWWFETEDLLAKQDGLRRMLREALGDDAG